MKIVSDIHISDYETVKRSWKERLFSRPWRPFVRFNKVHKPKVYQFGDTYICSPQTEARIQSALKNSSPLGWESSRHIYPEYYCPKLDLAYDDVHDFDR